jgi:Na+-driven multidrug efflux pump
VLVPTGISMFSILAVEVPVAWLVSRLIGLDGVWVGYPAGFLAMLALQTAYYRLVWRKKPIRRL